MMPTTTKMFNITQKEIIDILERKYMIKVYANTIQCQDEAGESIMFDSMSMKIDDKGV